MAEEAIQEVTTEEVEPQGETETKETDWKAEARKWEQRAKKSQAAEIELEKLKAAQMTEQEKAIARAEAAENELNALKAEKAKNDAARRLSNETGVPFEMLMFCSDEDAMVEFAKTYAKESHVSSAPKATNGSRIIKGGETKPSNREIFAQFAAENLKF